jgi:DNA-binding NarL/FixJ family response regulator
MPSILLADDHRLVAEGLACLLQNEYKIVGIVENGFDLLQEAQRLGPEVVISDIGMPELGGLGALRKLKVSLPITKVIFLTMHADPELAAASFRSDVDGYLLKQNAAVELSRAVREVLAGRNYITPLIEPEGVDALLQRVSSSNAPPDELSRRQRQVLTLIAQGLSIKEIASLLGISHKTVEFHKYNLTAKLRIDNMAGLTRYAFRHGLV